MCEQMTWIWSNLKLQLGLRGLAQTKSHLVRWLSGTDPGVRYEKVHGITLAKHPTQRGPPKDKKRSFDGQWAFGKAKFSQPYSITFMHDVVELLTSKKNECQTHNLNSPKE